MLNNLTIQVNEAIIRYYEPNIFIRVYLRTPILWQLHGAIHVFHFHLRAASVAKLSVKVLVHHGFVLPANKGLVYGGHRHTGGLHVADKLVRLCLVPGHRGRSCYRQRY